MALKGKPHTYQFIRFYLSGVNSETVNFDYQTVLAIIRDGLDWWIPGILSLTVSRKGGVPGFDSCFHTGFSLQGHLSKRTSIFTDIGRAWYDGAYS